MDTDEETEEETDDDKDDETWTPKPIGTSRSTQSAKKTRAEPVRHCIIGLACPKKYDDLISKNKFGARKEVIEMPEQVNKGKEQVSEIKEVVNKGKRKMFD